MVTVSKLTSRKCLVENQCKTPIKYSILLASELIKPTNNRRKLNYKDKYNNEIKSLII